MSGKPIVVVIDDEGCISTKNFGDPVEVVCIDYHDYLSEDSEFEAWSDRLQNTAKQLETTPGGSEAAEFIRRCITDAADFYEYGEG